MIYQVSILSFLSCHPLAPQVDDSELLKLSSLTTCFCDTRTEGCHPEPVEGPSVRDLD